jgi:hypothetical protein
MTPIALTPAPPIPPTQSSVRTGGPSAVFTGGFAAALDQQRAMTGATATPTQAPTPTPTLPSALAPAVSPALTQGFLRTGGGASGAFAGVSDQPAVTAGPDAMPGAIPMATPAAAAAVGAAGALPPGPRLTASTLNRKSEAETRRAIHKSAQDFEATTLGQMLQFMSDTIEVDPDFGGGHGEEMFRQMLTTEYGKLMRKSGGAGIAPQVERELLRAQGLKPEPTPARTGGV